MTGHCCVCDGKRPLGAERPCGSCLLAGGPRRQGYYCDSCLAGWMRAESGVFSARPDRSPTSGPEARRCRCCSGPLPDTAGRRGRPRLRCVECAARRRVRWNGAVTALRAGRTAAGLCHCGKEPAAGARSCDRCLSMARAAKRRRVPRPLRDGQDGEEATHADP